ncbi:MAG: hypothetical protein NC926_06465 [Candidatus Omnitrophica bacterium]|nr:hypothetical protein [Candidatus Omnitrophota bacterium]
MDLIRYKEKKQKGLISLIKQDDVYLMSIKRFDPETGERIDDEIIQIDIGGLKEIREHLQKQIEAIDELLKDIEKLK